ncbi:hypothetical protein [Bacteroides xylanisolvens]|nr:hypothetical protein [Bacteroides xylanisolvens]
MNSGKLRVSYGKNGNRSLENPYEALANLYPGVVRCKVISLLQVTYI